MEKVNCQNCDTDNSQVAKYCSGCGFALPKSEAKQTDTVAPKTTPERSEKRKKIISTIIGALAFGLSYFVVQYFFFEKPSLDKVMIEVASEMNKNLPMMIDRDTRLDNTAALANNSFQYTYTLVNMVNAEVDADELKNYLKPILINNISTHPDMKIFRDNKATLVYNYKDKNGVFVFKLNISPDQYE